MDGRQMARSVAGLFSCRITLVRNTVAQVRIDGSGWAASLSGRACGCGQMQYRRRAGTGGGTSIAWMSGKTSKRQGGPARFSKQPSIWHRVEAGGGRVGSRGPGGVRDWPTGVELDGPPAHCIHPGRTHDGPRSFAALSSSHMVCRGVHLPHALGSRYEACRASPIKGRGRCVPAHTVQPGNSPYEVPPHRIWP
jgi:hypothetical protein